MKRTLITGAAGFLGSHLCDRFIKEGHHVIGKDNLITGDLKNIEHLMGLEQFEFSHHDVTIGPRGVYDEAKRFQESITMAYHRFHGLDTRIVRIFNTYGPRMRLNDGRVIPAFMGQALRGEDLTVFGDGSQTRSFCFVDDEIEGIYRLLMSDYTMPMNIGNPHEITIKDFAEEIIKLTGTDQKIIYKPLPKDDPMQRQPDISKAKEILGWEPKVGRAEGMKKTFEYFKTLSREDLDKTEHRDFSEHNRK